MKLLPILLATALSAFAADPQWITLESKPGAGSGKHIVLLSGDEEYRSEEGLPQLARILNERHGFKCTVVFAINPKTGEIDPNTRDNAPGVEALDSADLCIMALRFRAWPDSQMKHFADYYLGGKPIIALRTSTHAFNFDKAQSAYTRYSFNAKDWPGGFGRQVLGETWVAHHGKHKVEGTRGIIDSTMKDVPILRGVAAIFGDTDVYTAAPPDDAIVLVRGEVTTSLDPASPPVADPKKNNPMQPVVWLRTPKNEDGKTNKILTTTMGSATDLKNEGLRRLLVNTAYAFTGMDVPVKADVEFIGDYQPTMYGFNGFKKGVKPADLAK